MDDAAKVVSLKEKKGDEQTPPFVPWTGNPENGDYLDWYRHLRKGEVIPFEKHKTT